MYRLLRHPHILKASMVLAGAVAWALHVALTSAVPLLANRSITLASPNPGATTTHTYGFEITTTNTIGSIAFEYCENTPIPDLPCDAPPGLDVTGAVLTDQQGETGFAVDTVATTANRLVLTRTATATVPGPSTYQLDSIVNPAAAGSSYVRISTHGSIDASDPAVDFGAVVYAILTGLTVNAYVPPYLRFCTAVSIPTDCDSAVGANLSLNILRPTTANAAQSQMQAFTNDESGYQILMVGSTMTSGNNTIQALVNPAPNAPGSPQFGLNLRQNTDPNIGADPQGAGTGTPAAGYGTPDMFKFVSGDTLATSTLPTEPNTYTVSYLVNIPRDQPGGVYATTVTYIATASF